MSLLDYRPAVASRWRQQDWILTGAAITLAFLGTLLVWSATRPRMITLGLDPQNYLKKHLLTLIIAFALGWATSRLNYPLLRAYAPIVYGLSILGLIAVLLIGTRVNGIRAWISLPAGFTLQPAEFTKIAVVIIISFMLGELRDPSRGPSVREVLQVFALVGVPLALIMLQPDLGTALVISVTMMGVLAIGGAARGWFIAWKRDRRQHSCRRHCNAVGHLRPTADIRHRTRTAEAGISRHRHRRDVGGISRETSGNPTRWICRRALARGRSQRPTPSDAGHRIRIWTAR